MKSKLWMENVCGSSWCYVIAKSYLLLEKKVIEFDKARIFIYMWEAQKNTLKIDHIKNS